MSTPSPDGTYVTVANQNGKLFERIRHRLRDNTFVLEPAATIDLANCTTPNGLPCQSLRAPRQRAHLSDHRIHQPVHVRHAAGGRALRRGQPGHADADRGRVRTRPSCTETAASAPRPRKMYIDSGGGTAANLYQADLYVFPLSGSPARPTRQTADAGVVFSEATEDADAHGAAMTRQDDSSGWRTVAATSSGSWTRTPIRSSTGSSWSTSSAWIRPQTCCRCRPTGATRTCRCAGPIPLTADPHVSTGTTPGIGVLKVTAGGRSAKFESIARVSNIDIGGAERADVHASTVRMKK